MSGVVANIKTSKTSRNVIEEYIKVEHEGRKNYLLKVLVCLKE
jgi:hypothetical protein